MQSSSEVHNASSTFSLKAPKTWWGQFLLFFVTEFISFFILVANTRATAQGSYLWSAVTDTLFSAQGFVMFKFMADDINARTWWSGLGCTLGGTFGSLLSIWATKHLYGV